MNKIFVNRNVLKLLLTDTLRSLNRRYYISARRYEIPLLRLARAEFSFREEKFRMSKRPCNVLLINDISINEIPNHFNFIFLAAKGVIIFLCSYSNGKLFTCEDDMFNIFTACEVSCLRAKAMSPGISSHLCSCI